MTKTEMTAAIIQAKQQKSLTWESIAAGAGLSPVFTTSACLGMNSLAKEPADKICTTLDLPPEVSTALAGVSAQTLG